MESQNHKASAVMVDGVEGKGGANSQRGAKSCDVFLRVLGLVLTLAAAIVLGVNKQTKIVPIKLVDTLPPLYVPTHAKWRYLSAFVYFVVSNAIASSYAALSLLLSMSGKKGLRPWIAILDVVMVALLFSSNGAAGAIGLMGYQGNKHVRWDKVCGVFGKFCGQVAASLLLSMLGSIVFLLLVVFAAFRLHRKSM